MRRIREGNHPEAGGGVRIAIVTPIACVRLHLMKRLLRVMFNGVTILSLLLSLAFAALWGRSYWKCEDVVFVSHQNFRMIAIQNFRNGFMVQSRDPDFFGLPLGFSYGSGPPHSEVFERARFGIQWYVAEYGRYAAQDIIIPHAYFIALFALLPARWLYRRIRRRATRLPGHCRTCGYDLRATPDRCPECGAVSAGVIP